MSMAPAGQTTGRGFIVAGLLLSISLAALDSTVVATAIPTIVGSLGGLSLFSWVFSIYLLTSTVTVPLYGKLADLYGRKPVLLAGSGLFLLGSGLCGLSQSMEQLIFFRAVQGLGAGSVQPMVMTIIGDLFTIEQRARIQGMTGSVWGIAGIAGPAIGAVITETIGWRWVFYVNAPLGLAGMGLIWVFFHESMVKRDHVLDYTGAALLSSSVVSLLLALLQGVDSYGWTGTETLALFGLAMFFLALFIMREQRAPEPLLSLALFKNRIVAIACVAGFAAGGIMYGVESYVPIFAQGVYGGSAIDAGLLLGPMSIGWPAAAVVSGKMIPKLGYYPSAMLGGFWLVLGTAILLLLHQGTPQIVPMAAVFVIGMGMGFLSSALLISAQNAVEWSQRGVVTALSQFMRTIGGSISVAIMGAVMSGQLVTRLAQIPGAPPTGDANAILTPESRATLDPTVLDRMQGALADSLHETYFLVLAAAVITWAVVLFFPRGKAEELQVGASPPPRETPASSGVESRAGLPVRRQA